MRKGRALCRIDRCRIHHQTKRLPMSDSLFEIEFPSVAGKPVVLRFDGGEMTSDAGLLALAQADRKLRLTERLAAQIADPRQQTKVRHSVLDLLRERVFAIAAGYEDANDL